MTKQCFTCKEIKPKTEFYTSPQRKDGYLPYCKICHNARIKAGRERRLAGGGFPPPAPGTFKICRACHVDKPIEEFGRNKNNCDGVHNLCKPCAVKQATESRGRNRERHRVYNKAWAAANPDKVHQTQIRRKYGIDRAEYDAMLTKQGGKCAICGATEAGARTTNFHVDHCHDSSKVRGLLCASCNMGIGQLGHDRFRLIAAISYLDRTS